MSTHNMKVESREGVGSNVVKKLRFDHILPGVVYKRGQETVAIQVPEADFMKTYKAAGSTSVINMELDGETYPVIIKEIQRDPVKSNILHIDFLELDLSEKVKLFVPVNLLNKDNIRLQPSVLAQMLEHVEIECLPADMPNTADVDVANMVYGDSFFVRDLDIAKDSKLTMLTDEDMVVCSLLEPSGMSTAESEEAAAEEAAAESAE